MGDRALFEAENSCELTGVHERTIEEVEFWEKHLRGLDLIMGAEEVANPGHDAGFTAVGCCLGHYLCSCNEWIVLAACTGREINTSLQIT